MAVGVLDIRQMAQPLRSHVEHSLRRVDRPENRAFRGDVAGNPPDAATEIEHGRLLVEPRAQPFEVPTAAFLKAVRVVRVEDLEKRCGLVGRIPMPRVPRRLLELGSEPLLALVHALREVA